MPDFRIDFFQLCIRVEKHAQFDIAVCSFWSSSTRGMVKLAYAIA